MKVKTRSSLTILIFIMVILSGSYPSASIQARSPLTTKDLAELEASEESSTTFGISDGIERAILLQVFDTSIWDTPSPDPVGIDYLPALDMLIISDSEVDEIPEVFKGANVYFATLQGKLQATCSTLGFSKEPTSVAVNPDDGNVFISDDSLVHRIFELELVEDGQNCPLSLPIRSFSTSNFNSYDAEGLTFGQGKTYFLDGQGSEVFILSPGTNLVIDGVPPDGDDQIQQFDTLSIGIRNPKGIAFHTERGTLFIVSEVVPFLFELTTDGTLLSTYDIWFSGIMAPSGVAIGPSSQNPEKTSFYITDHGIDNDIDPTENDGKVYEFAIPTKYYFPYVNR